jgi:SAM-dependent methyltransferase
MCHSSCITFGEANLTRDDIDGKRVLEVGSFNVNGSLRTIVESLRPREYIGVDFQEGPGVDEVCNADRLVDRFGENAFDVLISTEMLEHVRNWKRVISNLKRVLKPGGVLAVTTRSKGYPYHSAPFDFWRFEIRDMEVIFSDLKIETLQTDPEAPGVFLKARKPAVFDENDLSKHQLYSMIKWKRVSSITDLEIWSYRFRYLLRHYASIALPESAKTVIKDKVLHE